MINIDQLIIEVTLEHPSKFLGDCFRIRLKPNGEEWWQHMMDTGKPISKEEFLSVIDPRAILDEDETFEQFLETSSFRYFFKSGDVYFMTDGDPNGFEYFWSV
jgi:hypothetical protein